MYKIIKRNWDNMKIPFFVQEFTDEMEEAAIHALRNESFVGG